MIKYPTLNLNYRQANNSFTPIELYVSPPSDFRPMLWKPFAEVCPISS